MKKYMLLSLFSSCVNACNLVPVVKLSDQGKQPSVYSAICANSLSVIQGRVGELTQAEKNAICADPSRFLASKIMEQDSGAEIAFIPKSLYQLFVFSKFLYDARKVDEQNLSDRSHPALDIFFAKHSNISFNTYNLIDCAAYMNNPNVLNFWGGLNTFIVQFLGRDFITKQYAQEQLSNITHRLFENIGTYHGKNTFSDTMINAKVGQCLMDTNAIAYKQAWPMIDDIIWTEYTTRDCYLVYRGTSDEFQSLPQTLDHSFSLSDGLFGGIVYDSNSGMAFNYWCGTKKRPLLSIHLPLADLLSQTNGAQIFNIPAVISLGAALGCGEYHHVRTKVLQ